MTIIDDYQGKAFDYEGIKALSKETKRNIPDLLVLTEGNDPFYAGVGSRLKWANWFAERWQEYRFWRRRCAYPAHSLSHHLPTAAGPYAKWQAL